MKTPIFPFMLMIALSGLASRAHADTVRALAPPVINNIHFSASSSENGICRALGYERAAVGSKTTNSTPSGSAMGVDNTGDIVSGEFNKDWVSQILCVNPRQFPVIQAPTLILPQLNGIYFSNNSDEDGTCRALGYEHGAPGSKGTNTPNIGPSLIARTNGVIRDGEFNQPWISSLICVNLQGPPKVTARAVGNPQKDASYFSSKSDQNGICSSLGYLGAAVGTEKTEPNPNVATLIVGADGRVIGGESVGQGEWVANVVCLLSAALQLNVYLPPAATPAQFATYLRGVSILFYPEKADFLERTAKIAEGLSMDALEGAKARLFLANAVHPFLANVLSEDVQRRVLTPFETWLKTENETAHIQDIRELDRDSQLDKLALWLLQASFASIEGRMSQTDQEAIQRLTAAIGLALAETRLNDRKLEPVLDQLHDQEPMIAALIAHPRLGAFGQTITNLEGYLHE